MSFDKDEKRIAAANYLLGFDYVIKQLTDCYAIYLNNILNLEFKYTGLDLAKVEENEKVEVVANLQNVRYCAHKCYIMYETILPSLKITLNKAIEVTYRNKIRDTFIINRQDLEDFIIELNSVLVKDVIKELMDTSTQLIDRLYSTQNAPSQVQPQ